MIKKKIGSLNLGSADLNQIQNDSFCYFLKFATLVFLEIAYNDSLQQCLTSSGGKAFKERFWDPSLGQASQNCTRNQVFCYFLKFDSLIFLEIACDDTWK